MPCINLKGEMAKNGITIEAIAKLLGIHRNSAANKINGDSSFTIDEAITIQRSFFQSLHCDIFLKKNRKMAVAISKGGSRSGNSNPQRREQEFFTSRKRNDRSIGL